MTGQASPSMIIDVILLRLMMCFFIILFSYTLSIMFFIFFISLIRAFYSCHDFFFIMMTLFDVFVTFSQFLISCLLSLANFSPFSLFHHPMRRVLGLLFLDTFEFSLNLLYAVSHFFTCLCFFFMTLFDIF